MTRFGFHARPTPTARPIGLPVPLQVVRCTAPAREEGPCMPDEMRAETIEHLLDQAERSIRASGRSEPLTVAGLMERATHFASEVRLALDDPTTIEQLHASTRAIAATTTVAQMLPVLMSRSVALVGADLGDVRLRDPTTGTLRLVAHAGLDADFVSRFGLIGEQEDTPCGHASRTGRQVVVEDLDCDLRFPQFRLSAAHVGFRAMLCTPMRDYGGRTIGVVSTHWRRPHRPSTEELCLVDLLAGFSADQLTRRLGVVSDADPAVVPEGAIEAAVRAIIVPLLTTPEGMGEEIRRARGDTIAPAALAEQFRTFADQVVRGLLAAALTLDSARSVVPDGPAADRLSAASQVIDRMLQQVRDFMVHGRLETPRSAAQARANRQATTEAG